MYSAFVLALLLPTQSLQPAPFPLVPTGGVGEPAGLVAQRNDGVFASMRGADNRRLAAPVGLGLDGRVLVLERAPVVARGQLFVDGEPAGELGQGLEFSAWRGQVEGEPKSDVFLAFSRAGSRGWIRSGGRLLHLVSERDEAGRGPRSRWLDEAELSPVQPFQCETRPTLASGAAPHGNTPSLPPGAQAALANQPLFRCRVAVETDTQFFQLFGNPAAAESYVLALFAAVASTYRDEIGTVIEIPYLGLYTGPNDPWTAQDVGGGAGDLLYEFQAAWGNGAPLPADLNHFVSGAGLGGGVAWLEALCSPYYGFAVSGNIGGNTPFPLVQGPLNWDYFVVSHEMGHNFASPHTHDYCPPLDQCAPDGYWGGCQTASVCQPGTIMSYCHLCDGGIGNIAPTFHPTVRERMRQGVLASCLLPYTQVAAVNLGQGHSHAAEPLTLGAAVDSAAQTLSLPYAGAPSPTAGVLVVGAFASPLPLALGTLVPSADVLLNVAASANAGSFGPYTLVAGYPAGIGFVCQAWLVDLAAPDFLRSSNALEVEVFVPAPPAPLNWIPHPTNGLEYAIVGPGTWFQCEKAAAAHGAVLAALDSAALQSFAFNAFIGSGLTAGPVHIGYTDRYSEGTFQWVSGATGTYTNWAAGEPNNYGGTEDFAQWPWNGSQWNDGSGYEFLPGLVQRSR